VTGHILFCDWRNWQFLSVNDDSDRAFLVFSQRKPPYLIRSVFLSVRMQTVELPCGSLMTFGRVMVSCAALCVCRFHSWLKWEITPSLFYLTTIAFLAYTAAHVPISWVGSLMRLMIRQETTADDCLITHWLCLMDIAWYSEYISALIWSPQFATLGGPTQCILSVHPIHN
jgi:hypothetical protein